MEARTSRTAAPLDIHWETDPRSGRVVVAVVDRLPAAPAAGRGTRGRSAAAARATCSRRRRWVAAARRRTSGHPRYLRMAVWGLDRQRPPLRVPWLTTSSRPPPFPRRTHAPRRPTAAPSAPRKRNGAGRRRRRAPPPRATEPPPRPRRGTSRPRRREAAAPRWQCSPPPSPPVTNAPPPRAGRAGKSVAGYPRERSCHPNCHRPTRGRCLPTGAGGGRSSSPTAVGTLVNYRQRASSTGGGAAPAVPIGRQRLGSGCAPHRRGRGR